MIWSTVELNGWNAGKRIKITLLIYDYLKVQIVDHFIWKGYGRFDGDLQELRKIWGGTKLKAQPGIMKLYAFLSFVALLRDCGAFVKIDVSKSTKNLQTTTEITNVGEVVVPSLTTIADTTTAGTTTTATSTTKISPKSTTKVSTLNTTPTPQKVTTLKPDSINETKNESVPIYEWPTASGAVNKRLHTPEDYYCSCDLTVSTFNEVFFLPK